jgi:hypothetical protein
MANPNLYNTESLYGRTTYVNVGSTPLGLLSNPLNSGYLIKINNLSVCSNVAYSTSVTVDSVRNGTEIELVANLLIPSQTTVKINNRIASMYLEEGDTLTVFGSHPNALTAFMSYDVISTAASINFNPGTTYAFNSLPASLLEGSLMTIVVNTTGVNNGTSLFWTNGGNVSTQDLVTGLTLGGLYGQYFSGDWRSTISTGNIGTLPLSAPTLYTSISYGSRGDTYGFIAIGYFIPPTSGTYTFYTSSDDGSGVWIGDIASAESGRNTSNAVVNNGLGAGQGDTKRSGTVVLTGGQAYAIRIVHEEGSGGDNLTFSWSGPGITETTNLAQYFYYSGSGNNYGSSSASGSITINNNIGLLTTGFKSNATIDPGRTLTVQLRTDSIAGNIVATSNAIVKIDSTSLGTITNPATSAQAIKTAIPSATDGVYYILIDSQPVPVYCLMDSRYDGGGWMLAMKATRGTTFSFTSNHWTTTTTLNTGQTNRNDGDAKFDIFNTFLANDVMATWPDLLPGTVWIEPNFNAGTRTTMISFFNTVDNYNPNNRSPRNAFWNGGSQFSSQGGNQFYGFNFTSNSAYRVRWGFGWNNEGSWASNDVGGGIGMAAQSYSAGDYISCCADVTGFNRSARVEIWIR